MPLRYNSINIIYALPEKLIAFTKYNLLPRTADMLRITQSEQSLPMKKQGEIFDAALCSVKSRIFSNDVRKHLQMCRGSAGRGY